MIDLIPDPVAFAVGPRVIHRYDNAYAVGLAAAYLVIGHEARPQPERRHPRPRLIDEPGAPGENCGEQGQARLSGPAPPRT